MRLRKKPWAEDYIKEHPRIVIPNPEEWKGRWHEFFGNHHPIHIELGTGKGQFVVGMAAANPQLNYIGVELQTSVIAVALRKVKDSEQSNVTLLRQNVADLASFFEVGELERVYLNFSDPWPKNRHEKRRLTYKKFLHLYHHLLGAGKDIHMKTDNEGLFEYSLNSFSASGCRLKNVSLDLHRSDFHFQGNIMTEYEEKFSEKGMRIFRCEAVLPDKIREDDEA
ncbi:tRNA (guanosine(46)-N7)-methyltransferase TrmB [Caldalkalibacillus salinus]|uniref:tRNA (guanosine(46)-N7)-methyltransferase TrmB n=1 Tax=Caldalkalibacillus salinus TaxID=2803787 RepID=UPI0019227A0D|nr:tRNA (guanosine(46)-N7)-methyltransferase TrmB [Caldalkalibacillus salinus]